MACQSCEGCNSCNGCESCVSCEDCVDCQGCDVCDTCNVECNGMSGCLFNENFCKYNQAVPFYGWDGDSFSKGALGPSAAKWNLLVNHIRNAYAAGRKVPGGMPRSRTVNSGDLFYASDFNNLMLDLYGLGNPGSYPTMGRTLIKGSYFADLRTAAHALKYKASQCDTCNVECDVVCNKCQGCDSCQTGNICESCNACESGNRCTSGNTSYNCCEPAPCNESVCTETTPCYESCSEAGPGGGGGEACGETCTQGNTCYESGPGGGGGEACGETSCSQSETTEPCGETSGPVTPCSETSCGESSGGGGTCGTIQSSCGTLDNDPSVKD